MAKDDISKIEEQVKELEGENQEEEVIEETKKVDNIQELEDVEEEHDENSSEIIPEEEDIEEKQDIDSEEEKKEELEDVPIKEDKKDKKKNSKKIIIISLIVGIVVLLSIVFILLTKTKKVDTSSKELSQGEKKQIIEEYGDALEGIISVYLERQQVLLEYDDAIQLVKYDYNVVCDEHEIYDDGQIYLNKCSINDIGVTYSYGTKQAKPVIKEGAIKVYVSKKTKEATLKEPGDIKQYDLYSFDIEGKYENLTLLGKNSPYVFYYSHLSDSHCMLNYITGEKALKNVSYEEIIPIVYEEKYDPNYAAVMIHEKWGIFNLETDEKVIPTIYSYFPTLSMGVSGPLSQVTALADGIVPVSEYYQVDGSTRAKYGLINYRTKQVLISCDHQSMFRSGNYLWAIDAYDNKHIYDFNGVDQFDFSSYDDVYGFVDGKYILVNVNNHIKLVSLSKKEYYDYGEIKLGRYYYGLTYKNGSIFQFEDPEKDNEDLDHQCLELIYDASLKTGEVKSTYCGGIAKPILYLYPEKTTKVTVSFEHPEFLETTYPKFIDKWEVTAKKNGDLTDKEGKYYYGLYWDEAKTHFVDFHEGYYVTKENAIDFLEKKLTYIGLNDKERNEFIMYWLPILEKNEKNLVYFELTEERESYNKIFITPKPDSLLRIVIHVKKVDHEVEIPKQKLTKFQRKGFVAVEWGGTTY